MLVIFSFKTAYAFDSCQVISTSTTETAIVKWVYDGDTLLVTDTNGKNKRKIRIIGIDTPEVKHHQQKAQFYGAKAREELRVLLKDVNYRIVLEYDKEKHDRYKRVLAHVYLDNGLNISEWLLQQGYAKTLIIPPNVNYAKCYKNAERQAQQQKLRLWNLKSNQPKTSLELKSNNKGYVRLKGKISQIKQQKKTLVLELESKSKNPIQIRIKKKYLHYFKELDTDKLVAQQVIVSGILKNKKGKRIISLKHPIQLELLSVKKTSNKLIAPTIKWSLEK